ncbi:biotin/lipoyl-containing protein [Microbacterium sp.]|uniref:biotin/lipoyl-containing protein n=1 Tax=Microbacterium sp. TaxID=51671 RepID=UPI0039E601F7
MSVDAAPEAPAALTPTGSGTALVTIDALTRPVVFAGEKTTGADALWIASDGVTLRVTDAGSRPLGERADRAGSGHRAGRHTDASPQVVSPLPGTVVLVPASEGDQVQPGDALVVVEAMKMEHVLRAAVAGTVRLAVAVGDRVARGAVVATVAPAP